ncbi:MAG TPA: hypothetical protein VH087_16570 [Thermoanaerobaculia bacterium]|jgi:sugar lactone lactonase YvrE|nr:hypothetical protein [Thermoanaerobaculia bacterium]
MANARWRWCCCCLTVTLSLFAQNYTIRTVAGFGTFGGDGGPAAAALVEPQAVTVDSNGVVYVADNVNYRIRKIDNAGNISTVIGRGYGALSDGPAATATMSTASALALDAAGNLYFSDAENQRIREVTTSDVVRTVAGNGDCGTPAAGMAATQAPLCDVEGLAVDAQGRVFFGSNGQVWMISNGSLVLIAGSGGVGNTGDNGPATAAQIGFPGSLAVDSSGNVYIADQFNFVIREVTADKVIHTVTTISDISASTINLALDPSGALEFVTGTKQVFMIVGGSPVATATPLEADYLAVDRTGAVYVSSIFDERLMKMSGVSSAVIAGAYPTTLDPLPAPATSVRLNLNPIDVGLAVDAAGNIYFPEFDNALSQRIDKVTPAGTMTALAAPATLPGGGSFNVHAIAIGPGGAIYFSTFSQVYRLDAGGTATLIAGAPGFPSALGDGGPATAAKVTSPSGLAFDASGNLYIAEPFDSRVRKVTPQGIISTYAGTGQAGYDGDGGLAVNARLAAPADVKTDGSGNVYIADVSAAVVRKVATNGIITTVEHGACSQADSDRRVPCKAESVLPMIGERRVVSSRSTAEQPASDRTAVVISAG